MPSQRFVISVAENAFDRRPRPRALSLETLLLRLTTFRHRPDVADKRHLAGWIPAEFTATRRAENVTSVSCLVLDFDSGISVEAARAPWLTWTHLVYSSWRNHPDHPKFRVVLPLAVSVPGRGWPSAWTWAWEHAGHAFDEKCKDAGRMYFLPAIRGEGHPHFAHVHLTDELLELPWSEPAPVVRRPPAPVSVPRSDAERVARRRLNRMPEAREAFADALGARVAGPDGHRRAEDAICPGCGRLSAWFWIDLTGPMRRAACSHRNTCGWRGALTDLGSAGAVTS